MTGVIIGDGISIMGGISIVPEYDVPHNVIPPVITGNNSVNSTLTSTTGTWSSIYGANYAYQWQANSANIVSATANTYTLTSNELGDTILCLVIASNPSGSAVASSNSIGPIVAGVPLAPTGVTAVSSNGNAIVSFTASADNGGSPIINYTVYANAGGITATGNASPITVTGLTGGSRYTFTVKATNAIGQSPNSAPSASTLIEPQLGTVFRGGYYVGGNTTTYTVVVDKSFEGSPQGGSLAINYYFGDTINGYSDWDAGTLIEHTRAYSAQSALAVSGQQFDSTRYWTGVQKIPLTDYQMYWQNYLNGSTGVANLYTTSPYNGPSYPVRGFRRGNW